MPSALHQCIHLLHGYCTVKEIRQLRLASNDLYDAIATCEEVGSRLVYRCTKTITALRKPFTKIGLQLYWCVFKLDDPRIKSICTSIGRKLCIHLYNESSFELKDTSTQNLELKGTHGLRWNELESIVLHPGLKHLKLHHLEIRNVSVLQQIMSYDLISLKLEDIRFDESDPVALDFTTMTNLQELEIKRCYGIKSVTLPTSLKKIYLDSYEGTPIDFQTQLSLTHLTLNGLYLSSLILPSSLQKLTIKDCDRISTPIDFKKCSNLKVLHILYLECYNNTDLDLDLSTTSLTDLTLKELYLSSLILPHSMQQSYMRDPSSIIIDCTIPKVMIKNKPEPGCTEDSFTILPGIDGQNDETSEEYVQNWKEEWCSIEDSW